MGSKTLPFSWLFLDSLSEASWTGFGAISELFWEPFGHQKRCSKRDEAEKEPNAIRSRPLAFAHTFKGPREPFRRLKRSLGATFFAIFFGNVFGSVFMLIYVDLGSHLGSLWASKIDENLVFFWRSKKERENQKKMTFGE